jgi:serine/threonine protein kinase
VQLCDFGLARMLSKADVDDEPNLSLEVVTRSYRPPELFLGNASYSEKIDIWSLGCVIVEFFTKKKLFSSDNSKDILESIIRTVSEIDPNDLEFIEDPNAVDYIESIPRDKNGELRILLSGTSASKQGNNLIQKPSILF